MRAPLRGRGLRARLSGLVTGAALALVALGTTALPAHAEVPSTTGSVAWTACQFLGFPFTYEPDLTVSGYREAGSDQVTLVATLSDLPGVAPIPLTNAPITVTLKTTVDGSPVTMTGSGTTTAAKNTPIKLPEIRGTVTSSGETVDLSALQVDFAVTAMGGTSEGGCTSTAPIVIGEVPITEQAAPSPSPSPTPSESPSPSVSASATPSVTASPSDAASAGVPAKGTTTYACTLEPFNSDFDYRADITLNAMRATEGAAKVALAATFTDLPGIAPVPITNGTMKVTADFDLGGSAVTLTGSSTVNAAAKAKVPVPTLTGTFTSTQESMKVAAKGFTFDFGDMGGIVVKAACSAKSGAELSKMTVGVGALDDTDPTSSTTDAVGGGGGDASTSLPKTGGIDSIPVLALWALALGLIGAVAMVLLPARPKH